MYLWRLYPKIESVYLYCWILSKIHLEKVQSLLMKFFLIDDLQITNEVSFDIAWKYVECNVTGSQLIDTLTCFLCKKRLCSRNLSDQQNECQHIEHEREQQKMNRRFINNGNIFSISLFLMHNARNKQLNPWHCVMKINWMIFDFWLGKECSFFVLNWTLNIFDDTKLFWRQFISFDH